MRIALHTRRTLRVHSAPGQIGEIAALDDRLGEALQNSVLGEYVSERQATLGVSVNQANVNRVIGAGQGG